MSNISQFLKRRRMDSGSQDEFWDWRKWKTICRPNHSESIAVIRIKRNKDDFNVFFSKKKKDQNIQIVFPPEWQSYGVIFSLHFSYLCIFSKFSTMSTQHMYNVLMIKWVSTSAVILKLEGASEWPLGLMWTQLAGLHPQSFWLSRSGAGPENLHL